MSWGEERIWISQTVVFHLPYFVGECVTCYFDVCFDVKPTTALLLEVLGVCVSVCVCVSAGWGTRKSFFDEETIRIGTGIPLNTTRKPWSVWVCVRVNCITRELDRFSANNRSPAVAKAQKYERYVYQWRTSLPLCSTHSCRAEIRSHLGAI